MAFKLLALLSVSFYFVCGNVLAGQVVHLSDNVAPQSSLNSKGVPEGLIVDLAKEFFSGVEFQPRPLARVLVEAKQQNNTLVFISRTPSRESEYQWIAPVYATSVYVYVNRDSAAATSKSLKDVKSLGVIHGSSLIQSLPTWGYTGMLSTTVSNDANLKQLMARRTDGWVEGQIAAEYVMRLAQVSGDQFERIGPLMTNLTWLGMV